MIKSANEFIRLRKSEIEEEYHRATNDTADISTWTEIIEKHPDFKQWVVHNKTVPMEILEILTLDSDPNVRGAVARKRKMDDKIFRALSKDKDENTKLSKAKLKQIDTIDSNWLTTQLKEVLERRGV